MKQPLRRDIVRNWYPNLYVLCICLLFIIAVPGPYIKPLLLFVIVSLAVLILLFYVYKLPAASDKFNRKMLESSVFGHRGAVNIQNIDQNTLSAFQFAYDCDANGIECDVRFTKDNIAIIAHDYHVGNLTTPKVQHGLHSMDLHELTLDEIKKIKLKQNDASSVMTLDELVQFMNEHKFRKNHKNKYFCLLLEIKHQAYGKYNDEMLENIMQILNKITQRNERMVIISFSMRVIYRFRKKYPDINVGICFERHMWYNWILDNARPTGWKEHILHRFIDPLRTLCCRYLVPSLCGCVCVMMHSTLLSAHVIQHYYDNGISVCSYGASGIDAEWLLSKGVCCVVDDPQNVLEHHEA